MYKTLCKTLWCDEDGAILCAELVLVMTLLMCACVVGISSLRNAIATELADLAGALGVLNQSYSVGGIMSYHAWQPGNVFVDRLDSGDLLAADGADGVIICAAVCGNEAGLISHQGAATGQLITAPPRPDVHPSPPCPPPIVHPPVPPCPPVVIPCPPTCPPCGCIPGHHGQGGHCCPECRKHGGHQIELHQRIELDVGGHRCPHGHVFSGGPGPCGCDPAGHAGPHGAPCPRCGRYHDAVPHDAAPHHREPEPADPQGLGGKPKRIEPLPAPEPVREK